MIIAEAAFMSSWVELFGLVFVVVAGIWALLQWCQDKRRHCADVYGQLLATFASEEIFHAFEDLIDKGHFHGEQFDRKESSSWIGLERLDQVLMFLNQVCYLWENKMIGDVELQSFRYPLVRTLTNEEILRYLDSLQQNCAGEFMYESLMKYSETIEKSRSVSGKNPLTDKKWRTYLIGHFGGWTATAQDVSARVNSVCRRTNTTLDELIATVDVARKHLKEIDVLFDDKSSAQISSLRVAVRHCCMAKHGIWLKD